MMNILYINILFEGMNRILWTVRRGLDVDAQLIKGTLVFFVWASSRFICYRDTCLTFWVLEPPQLLKVGERRPVYLKGNTLTITIIPRNLVSNRFKCVPLDWKTPPQTPHRKAQTRGPLSSKQQCEPGRRWLVLILLTTPLLIYRSGFGRSLSAASDLDEFVSVSASSAKYTLYSPPTHLIIMCVSVVAGVMAELARHSSLSKRVCVCMRMCVCVFEAAIHAKLILPWPRQGG